MVVKIGAANLPKLTDLSLRSIITLVVVATPRRVYPRCVPWRLIFFSSLGQHT